MEGLGVANILHEQGNTKEDFSQNMTTLIAWVGVDSRGPASIYLASDSRVSWGNSSKWDSGRKLFASKRYPEILAYSGDVTFPIQVLSRIIDRIDNNLLIDEYDDHITRKEKIFGSISKAFEKYPIKQRNAFHIIYATRQHSGMKSAFHIFKLTWVESNIWNIVNLEIPSESGLIEGIGSGTTSVKRWYQKWQRSDAKRTSRSVFSAFCDSLVSQEDRYTGGAPQLVGIYRTDPARSFGIVYNNERFFYGERINENDVENLNNVEWRNKLFERCDGKTMGLLENAQKQPRPKNVRY